MARWKKTQRRYGDLGHLQYQALERDWNRLRDQDAEWRHFQKIVTRAVVVLAALFVIGALTGCAPDRQPDREPDLYLRDGTPCWNRPGPHGYLLRCDPTNKDKEKR